MAADIFFIARRNVCFQFLSRADRKQDKDIGEYPVSEDELIVMVSSSYLSADTIDLNGKKGNCKKC